MALLVVALVAGIAASLLADYGQAVTHLSGRRDLAQARWLARGGIDWARTVLEMDARRDGGNGVDTLREEWAIRLPPTPVEEGEISGEIEELSGRFNLNSLVSGGKPVPTQQAILVRLLRLMGGTESQAQDRTQALTRWLMQTHESGTEGGEGDVPDIPVPLLHVSELIAVQGFTPEEIHQLGPLIAALPPEVKTINVNTASAVVLAAHIEGLSLAQAQTLVFERERAFFTSSRNFIERLPEAVSAPAERFVVKSTYFLVSVRARWWISMTSLQAQLQRMTARPEIVWIRLT